MFKKFLALALAIIVEVAIAGLSCLASRARSKAAHPAY
jgi:hypothetical protein